MCGIAGVLVVEGDFRVTPDYLDAMGRVLRHRGPDGEGLWLADDGRVGLAHRRLAIVDLSPAANQPMSSRDGRWQLVFNGEIYNHAELRRELETLGHSDWQTDHADTEVVLHAFQQWGIDCLHRFRGMFAFALWDGERRELWLVRDRIGIKPLYYSRHHGRVTFASEIKALLQDPDQPKALDETALYHYLSFLVATAPQTLFAGIRKLPAGSWLRIASDGTETACQWWDVWDHVQPETGLSERDMVERVMAELRTAVTLHKSGDVPVGLFLSGGIDSGTNAALFTADGAEAVKAFCLDYAAGPTAPSEVPLARMVAGHVGAEFHHDTLSPESAAAWLPELPYYQDEPIADPICVSTYTLAKLARSQGVTVCQVGEGADELFYGYPAWHTALKLQQWGDRVPLPAVKRAGLAALRAAGLARTGPYEWLRRSAEGLPVFWGGAEGFTETGKQRLLSPDWRRRFAGYSSWEALRPIRERFEAAAWEPSDAHWMTYLDLRLRLPELLLMRLDKMAMAAGVEGRVPFLDHRVVELVLSLPTRAKLGGGNPKHVLKLGVRGLIPDRIIDRPKQGFVLPVGDWLMTGLGTRMRQDLLRFCRETGLFDPQEIERLFATRKGLKLWYLYNLALWWWRFAPSG